MNISEAGLEHIKHFEGLRLKAYLDPVGIWTIGYGHTGKDVYEGLEITKQQAHDLLVEDVKEAEQDVNLLAKVTLTQGQYDALVDFAYNLGGGSLKSSTLLRQVNAGLMESAAKEFERWVYADGKMLPGLVKRREAAKQMFMETA